MKKKNEKIKTMDLAEATKILDRIDKEEGNNWVEHWEVLDKELLFIKSSLNLISQLDLDYQVDVGSLGVVVGDLMERVEKVEKKLRDVWDELKEKHRLGPCLPVPPDRIFNLPKITVEKYKLV